MSCHTYSLFSFHTIFGKHNFNSINPAIYVFCKHYLLRKDIEITATTERYRLKNEEEKEPFLEQRG